MKAQDLRAKKDDELKGMLVDLAKERFNLRFRQATGQLESTAEIRKARRTVARIRTILSERQAAAGNDA